MNKTLFALFMGAFLLFFTINAVAEKQQRFRVMEYNVENLFDTIHAEGKSDAEFTPCGAYRWTKLRYLAKLSRLARVIAGAGGDRPVDAAALIEVENDSVLSHLTRRTKLARLGYEYIITHSEDVRGINVALIYQPARFRPVEQHCLRVAPIADNLHPTRDVLHVAGELTTGDTLDILVCHFPSRKGGRRARLFREAVASRVRTFADSLMHERKNPRLVLTGDFNSFYPEQLFVRTLQAVPPSSASPSPLSLCLLSHSMKARGDISGTYKYQGEWNQLDQFVVNGAMLHADCSVSTAPTDCRIVDFPFLLQNDASGEGVHPFRTYLGPYYQGGFSDHLPLLLDLWLSPSQSE